MRPQRIILIRHGQSEANVDPTVAYRMPDHAIPLTARGVEQAQMAGQQLKALVGDQSVACRTSPFVRARQTMDGVRGAFAPGQIVSAREDPNLREQDWPMPNTPTRAKRVQRERHAQGHYYYRIPPNGESGADVYLRVGQVIETMHRHFARANYPENTVLVTHGMTSLIFLMHWFHWSVDYFHALATPENCQLMVLERQANGRYQLTNELTQWQAK